MTREEAIDIVKCLAWHDLRPSEEDIEQAIEALSEPTTIKKAKEEVLMELLNYTYGMLTAEKFGLQGKIASMLHDIGAETESEDEE